MPKLSEIVILFDEAAFSFDRFKKQTEKELTEWIHKKYPRLKNGYGTFIVRDSDRICLAFTLYLDCATVSIVPVGELQVDSETKILNLNE